MKVSDLNIDFKKHVLYSSEIEKIIRQNLSEKYNGEDTDKVWDQIQLQYASFLKDLPYLGGKKNTHNGTGGTYDCIMLFAYYEVLDPKPSIDELYKMNIAVLLPVFEKMAGIVNANKPFFRRLLHLAFVITASKDDGPAGYIMKAEPYSTETKEIRLTNYL